MTIPLGIGLGAFQDKDDGFPKAGPLPVRANMFQLSKKFCYFKGQDTD
jgi:hypothetical protein